MPPPYAQKGEMHSHEGGVIAVHMQNLAWQAALKGRMLQSYRPSNMSFWQMAEWRYLRVM